MMGGAMETVFWVIVDKKRNAGIDVTRVLMGRSNDPESDHSSFADRRTGVRTGSKAEGDQG